MNSEWIRKTIHYDPLTGLFSKNGKRIGGKNGAGYIEVVINGHRYLAHRLAWLYVHGKWPIAIDHINRDSADNRIANLREATQNQNMANSGPHRDNRSGLKGISFDKKRSKWEARMCWHGHKMYLGRFNTPEEAREAYREVAEKLHREFAN